MTIEITEALAFAGQQTSGVLITSRANGRPQVSNIVFGLVDGTIKISITADRAKYRNIVRNPAVTLHVTKPDFSAYVVIDGAASVAPVVTDPGDATADELVALYRSIAGEHPDWDAYRSAMIADRRTVVTITPEYAYGMPNRTGW